MVLFWIPIIMRHLIFRVPKRDHSFDNHPHTKGLVAKNPSREVPRSVCSPALTSPPQCPSEKTGLLLKEFIGCRAV